MDELLIGRAKELAELDTLIDAARSGTGRVVLLAGEAGVGKSRLAACMARRSGATTLVARYRAGGAEPYAALSDLVREVRRAMPNALPRDAVLRNALAALLPELGESAPGADPRMLVEAVAATLAAVAAAQLVLVVIEDLQWADDAVLDLLPGLADRLRSIPLVILATYRSDELPRGHLLRRTRVELKRAGQLHEITIGPLLPDDTTSLVEAILAAPVAPALAEEVHRRTQGLPLFVEELAEALREGGLLESAEEGMQLAVGRSIPLPESVRDAVVLRLDGLGSSAREAADVAAVAGTEIDVRLLDEIGPGADQLGELADRGLMVSIGEGRWAFRHDLTREAVREAIGWSRRRELHGKVAAWLEAVGVAHERVAEHWIQAGESRNARQALLKAADHSCHLHAYRDAARASGKALTLWPSGEEEAARLEALRRYAHCAEVSGQLGDTARALRELLGSPLLAEEPQRRAEVLRSLASVNGLQGNWRDAQAARGEAAEAFAAAGLVGEASAEWLAAARHQAATLDVGRALDTVCRAVDLARAAGRHDVEARGLGLAGNLEAMQGRAAEGRETAGRGLTLALRHNLIEAAADIYRRLAAVHEYESDYGGARQAYMTALDFCRSRGAEVQAQVCLGCMTYAVFRTGEWRRAAELCRDVIDDERSPSGSRSAALAMVGLVHALRGEQRPARKHLGEAVAIARRDENAAVELIGLWGLGLVDELDGNDERAGRSYATVLDRWYDTQDRHDAVPALMHIATWYALRGDGAMLGRATEALSTIAAATGNPEALAGLAHALGEGSLAHGDAVSARSQFEQAMSHLKALEVPLERAFVSFRLGVAEAVSGDREGALTHLQTAYREARRLGARPLAASAGAELSRLDAAIPGGDGRRDIVGMNRAGLTRRQAEIAQLVAQGFTNKKIAARLHLSHRTVDMHVRHILRRLDCRSRAEAVRKAAALGLLPSAAE